MAISSHSLSIVSAFLFACGVSLHGFSLDDPPGPQFTQTQKDAQIMAGVYIKGEIAKAFNSGNSSFAIPPGDYRFGAEVWGPQGPVHPMELRGMQRDAMHPFTIMAAGVTFWFDLPDDQAPTAHFAFGIVDCSHIIIDGLTIDRGTRGNLEGKIAQIDFANNRIEIIASEGSIVPKTFNNGLEQRLLPFKANGNFCAPLYALQSGGQSLSYALSAGTEAGRYWVTMRNTNLLSLIRDQNWVRAYGDPGILRAGDGLSLIYTTTVAISIVNSAHVTLRNLKNHIAKGGPSESGGYGGHLWKSCYFGPRPGTNQWQGGDGFMCKATRVGSILDDCEILNTTDDAYNVHGYWGYIGSVSGSGVIYSSGVPSDLAAGDTGRFFDYNSGAFLGGAKVVSRNGNTVIFDKAASDFSGGITVWPQHECAGWTVKNCFIHDCYQRVFLQGGTGAFSGNRLARNGSNVSIYSAVRSGNEGALYRSISITGNFFTDVAPAPHFSVIEAGFNAGKTAVGKAFSRISISGNTFNNASERAISVSLADTVSIDDNTINNPFAYTAMAKPGDVRYYQPVQLASCAKMKVSCNRLNDPAGYAKVSAATRSALVGVNGDVAGLDLSPCTNSVPERPIVRPQPSEKTRHDLRGRIIPRLNGRVNTPW
jgi:hypothetical protein